MAGTSPAMTIIGMIDCVTTSGRLGSMSDDIKNQQHRLEQGGKPWTELPTERG
jgi:hypothetical protein